MAAFLFGEMRYNKKARSCSYGLNSQKEHKDYIMRIRKAQASNFTTVQNSIINCPNLSIKAKGLYLYLFSKPDDWDFCESRIAKDHKDGRDSVRSGIKELICAGLIQRIRHPPKKNKEGNFVSEVEYIIYDDLPKSDFPTFGESNHNIRKSKTKKDVSLTYFDVEKCIKNFKERVK